MVLILTIHQSYLKKSQLEKGKRKKEDLKTSLVLDIWISNTQ